MIDRQNAARLWMSSLMAGLPNPLAGWRAPLAGWRRAPTDPVRYRRSSSPLNSRRPASAPPQVPLENAGRRTPAGFGAVPQGAVGARAWAATAAASSGGARGHTG